jgi:hypothetical protein
MHNPSLSGPSTEDAVGLHRRLLRRDPVAPADFAAAFLDPLIAWLQATHSSADPMACAEAAGEAIIGFLNNPSAYDPGCLGVEALPPPRRLPDREWCPVAGRSGRRRDKPRPIRAVSIKWPVPRRRPSAWRNGCEALVSGLLALAAAAGEIGAAVATV